MKYMSEVIYLKNTFFHMFKYVEVVKCIEKTYVSHSVVSDFLQLHGLKPTRVLCPWNFFFNSMDCSPPGSSVHGILQAKIVEWVAIPFSRGSSQTQELNSGLLHCRWILYCLIHQGSPIER